MRALDVSSTLLMMVASGAASAALGERPAACRGVAEPVVDLHVHSYTEDPRWTARAPSPATGRPLTAVGENAHRAATAAEHARHDVVRAIVDSDGRKAGTDDPAERMAAAAPSRYRLGFVLGEPTPERLAEIRKLHKLGKIEVIGEVVAQYHGIAANDPAMEPLWELAEELDLPVALHMGLGWPGVNEQMPKMRMSLGNPLLLEDVLVKHPRLRLFVMHAGWPHLEGMLAMLHSFPNLYAEVGIIDWGKPEAEFHTYLKRLVEAGFGDRIMFGSDQMVWPDAIGIAIGRIRSAPYLTGRQKRGILFDNAVRFFRWRDLEGC